MKVRDFLKVYESKLYIYKDADDYDCIAYRENFGEKLPKEVERMEITSITDGHFFVNVYVK